MDSRHGSWLAVLEKAYGIIRDRDREKAKKAGKPGKPREIVPTESLGGGSCPPIIALLTGHLAESVRVRNASSEHLHALLVDLNAKRRLMCLGLGDKDGKHPPGTGNHHAYGVFGYNSQQRRVTIFNPWGNNFTPKGPPGIANGYPTVNGLFTVPLDEFRQVFTALDYETDKPAHK